MRTFYETGRFVPAEAEGGEEVELDVRFRAGDAAVLLSLVLGMAVAFKALAFAWAHGLFGLKGVAAGAAVWSAWVYLRQRV